MKHYIHYILLLIAVVAFNACDDHVPNGMLPSLNSRYLFVPTTSMSFDAQPSTQKLDVESEQTDWVLNIPVDWVKSNQTSGNSSASLEISTLLNNSADTSRVCVATISSNVSDWNRSYPITISQAKAIPYITPEETNIVFDGKANSKTVSIATNATYSCESNSAWLKITDYTPTNISFTAEENTTGAERRARISITANGASSSIEVVQRIANISATTSTLNYDFRGGSKSITIESEAIWSAKASEWIELSPSSGNAGTHTVNVTVAKNASTAQRNGFVYVSIDSKHIVEIPVVQTGIYLYPDVEDLNFTSFGGTKNFFISTNDDWSVTSKPEWLTLSPMSGSGDKTFTATVKENNTTNKLSGYIIIQTDDKVITKTIHVTQERKSVEASDAQLSYGYSASTQTFSFNTDGGWTATKDADWISLNANEGTGNTNLQISVAENNETAEREGTVTLIIAGQKYTVGVHQDCKKLTISSDAFSFNSASGYSMLSIASNTSWTAKTKENYNWLIVTPKSGDNNAALTIAVSANNSVQERTGQVLVEIPNVKTYIVNVTQAGQYIKADRASVDFTYAGGLSEVINITTDGTYTISKDGNWFGYTTNGNAITVMAPVNSTGAERTGSIKFTLNCDPQSGPHLVVPVTQSTTSAAKAKDSGIIVVLKK